MQISPRYDGEPVVQIDPELLAVKEPFLRQRTRFRELAASLTPAQLNAQSRCEEWRVRDVLAHLADVDRFWTASIQLGVAGQPSRFLESFDPKATPATMVDGRRALADAEVVAALVTANEELCAVVEGLDDDAWGATGEAPPGHVSIRAVAAHALWDCWVHERDIAVPLGVATSPEEDEVAVSLAYVAALNPGIALGMDPSLTGTADIAVTDPDLRLRITVDGVVSVEKVEQGEGDLTGDGGAVRGPAVDVLEALSVRAPYPEPVDDVPAWLVGGLADVFETTA